jgi:hypothetical protein
MCEIHKKVIGIITKPLHFTFATRVFASQLVIYWLVSQRYLELISASIYFRMITGICPWIIAKRHFILPPNNTSICSQTTTNQNDSLTLWRLEVHYDNQLFVGFSYQACIVPSALLDWRVPVFDKFFLSNSCCRFQRGSGCHLYPNSHQTTVNYKQNSQRCCPENYQNRESIQQIA